MIDRVKTFPISMLGVTKKTSLMNWDRFFTRMHSAVIFHGCQRKAKHPKTADVMGSCIYTKFQIVSNRELESGCDIIF